MTRSQLVERAGPWGLYALARVLTRRHPRILMYHRFGDEDQAESLTASVFERQVRYVREHHEAVTLGELVEGLTFGARPPNQAISLTVDDGYHDFYDVAWPILRRYNVPATLFVTTGFVDGELWLWPDQLSWLLEHAEPIPTHLRVSGKPIPTEYDPAIAWQRLVDEMLALPDRDKREAIGHIGAELGLALPATVPPGYRSVTWDQLREMESQGLEIGGHTHTHPTLPRVDAPNLPGEIDKCLERLNTELGTRTRPFCYPNGQPNDFSVEVRNAVEAAGFSGAVVAYADATKHGDRYALRRHSSSANMFQFYKAASGLEWLGAHMRQGASPQ